MKHHTFSDLAANIFQIWFVFHLSFITSKFILLDFYFVWVLKYNTYQAWISLWFHFLSFEKFKFYRTRLLVHLSFRKINFFQTWQLFNLSFETSKYILLGRLSNPYRQRHTTKYNGKHCKPWIVRKISGNTGKISSYQNLSIHY